MQAIASDEYLQSAHFTPRERAAVLWAEHVARNSARDRDDVFAEVERHFSDAELVELTAVCGLFGQSNRFQDSMRLPIEPPHEVDKIRNSVRADPERLRAYVERLLEHWPDTYPSAGVVHGAMAGGAYPLPGTRLPPRVPLLDPATAPHAGAQFMNAARRLLGALPNAVRLWAHTPHAGKFFVPFFLAFERDGVGSQLPARLRLLVLLRTHHVHAATYLLAHHTLLGRAAGLGDAQLAAATLSGSTTPDVLTPAEIAAMAWAGQVARNTAKRDDGVFGELKRHFNDAQVVELTGLVALTSNADLVYNALRVPLEPADDIAALNGAVSADGGRLKQYLQSVLADWPQQWPALDAGRTAAP